MECFDLEHPPRLLTHHFLLRKECLARLTLPVDLTQEEAARIARFLGALVLGKDADEWPSPNKESDKQFEEEDDLFGDLTEIDVLTSEVMEEEDQLDQLLKDLENGD